MAEFATAASAFAVVSIAGQLAVGVKNLYSFWSSIQDALNDIQSLSRELKLFLVILQGIQQSEQRYGPDADTAYVLASCSELVDSLIAITDGLERGFATTSLRRRKWGATKAVFKRNTIKKFQDVLRDTKITLILAQQTSARRAVQDQFSLLAAELTKLHMNPQPLVLETTTAQPDYESHAGALQSQVLRIASITPNPALRVAIGQGVGRALERDPLCSSQRVIEFEDGSDNTTEPAIGECQLDHSKSRCEKNTVTYRSHSLVHNLFGTFTIESEVCRLAKSRNKDLEDLDSDDFVRKTSVRIHPAGWLIRLGISFGVQFAAQGSPQTWKHTLTTFRAVPDDTPIFSACRAGNLDVVRQLFTTGKASPWDTNSRGWTPLHFAAEGCHPDLCRYLISEGAEKSQATSDNFRSPLMLAPAGHYQDMQIDTLRLFQEEIDFSEEADSCSDGWRVLFFIIDQGRNDLTFHWLLQNFTSEIMVHFNEKQFANLLGFAIGMCAPSMQFVPSMLSLRINNIKEALDIWPADWYSVLHRSIIDGHFTTDLILKGANIHLRGWLENLSNTPKSPTSLAMLSSQMFYHWRASLHGAGVNIEDYVRNECENGAAVDEGWSEDTLLFLLRLEFPSLYVTERVPCCDRCFSWVNDCRGAVAVEVNWCLELDMIKRRDIGQAMNDDEPVASLRPENEENNSDGEVGKGLYCPCVQELSFVCWDCWKEIQDPNHEHWDSADELSCDAIEELSDSEFSPFHLST